MSKYIESLLSMVNDNRSPAAHIKNASKMQSSKNKEAFAKNYHKQVKQKLQSTKSFAGMLPGLEYNIDSIFSSNSDLNPPTDISHGTAKKIFATNVIVNHCIRMIAEAAGHVPWKLKNSELAVSEESLKTHKGINNVPHVYAKTKKEVIKLLNNPNPRMAKGEFFEQLLIHKLLFGNSFILATLKQNKSDTTGHQSISRLSLLNPEDVEILVDKDNTVIAYKHNKPSGTKIYHINPITNFCQILHIKTFNSHNRNLGTSMLTSAMLAIEHHNLAMSWNNSLLKNGARPCGALMMDTNSAGEGYLTEEQFERIKDEFQNQYSSARNAGKPMLLEGGMSWQDLSISPKDMDYIESKNAAAREISLALGVPPQLLGIHGDNTYSNMQEARLALWDETVLPLLDNLCTSLSSWLSNSYQAELYIGVDKDEISALSLKRDRIWKQLESANFVTINEKRAKIGLPPIKGGDQLQAPAQKP